MGDSYTWTATGSGIWSSASNWFDVTTGTTAATAPALFDAAEIDNAGSAPITVTGPADVLQLSASGNVILSGSFDTEGFLLGAAPESSMPNGPATVTSTIALDGTFNSAFLNIGSFSAAEPVVDYGVTDVDPGTTLSTGPLTVDAGDLQVDGGTVSAAGELTLGTVAFGSEALSSGSLDVTNQARVEIDGDLIIFDGSIGLDSTSTLEIGTAGTAAAGTITVDPDTAISFGLFQTGTASFGAPILNNGTIYADGSFSGAINDGSIVAYIPGTLSAISGDGLIYPAFDEVIGPGVSGTLDMSTGNPVTIDLGAGVPIDTADTPRIVNFTTDNQESIVLQGISADSAIYTPTGQGTGTLTLASNGIPVASLAVLGTYDIDGFTVVPETGYSNVTVNPAPVASTYTWIATGSGDWGNASNWFDITTGTPAAEAPGPLDDAEIDNAGTAPITVTGPADVLALSVDGDVTLSGSFAAGTATLGVPPLSLSSFGTSTSTIALAGTFSAGSLAIGDVHLVAGFPSLPVTDNGVVEVDQGAVLSAGSVNLNAGDLQVAGGAVSIASDLTLGYDLGVEYFNTTPVLSAGSLDVTNAGSVQIGGLLAVTDGSIGLDTTSTLEIGDAGTATAGTIAIDPDAMLLEGDGYSYVEQSYHDAETAKISAPILNNGTIETTLDLSNVINNGAIDAENDTLSFISGNGLTDITFEATIGPGDSGTFDIGFGSTIVIDLGAGVPIDTADTPMLAGFDDPSETIVVQGISADTAIYAPTGLGTGTLTLDSGTTALASLTMLGTYAVNSFSVIPEGGDSVITLNPLAVPNTYTWAAAGSGDWSNASNWFDYTTGTPATVAPGPLDTAGIDNAGTAPITVTGPGNAAELSVRGDVALAGSFNTGSLELSVYNFLGYVVPIVITSTIALDGTFNATQVDIGSAATERVFSPMVENHYGIADVDAGATLSSTGSLSIDAGDLRVDGGSVGVSDGTDLGQILFAYPQVVEAVTSGSLDVTNDGSVELGSLTVIDGSVSLDPTSTLEIGTAATATAGTITVDPNAVLTTGSAFQTTGTASFSAPILNNGTIDAGYSLSNVINNAVIELGAGVTVSAISGNGRLDTEYSGPTIGPGVSGTLDFGFGLGRASLLTTVQTTDKA